MLIRPGQVSDIPGHDFSQPVGIRSVSEQGPAGRMRQALLKRGFISPVDNPQGNLFLPLPGKSHGLIPLFRVMILKDMAALLVPGERIHLVESHTGLQYVYQAEAWMLHRPDYQFGQVLGHACKSPGHESGPHGHGNSYGVEGLGRIAGGLGLGLMSPGRSWTGLALGQPVYLVVVGQQGNIDIAAQSSQKMVAALAVITSIPALDNDHCLRVGQLDSGGGRQGPAVKSVEHVGSHIMRSLGCLAYAGNENALMRLKPHLHQGILD